MLNYISGYHRPFSLTDISIAYPNKPNTVSIVVVVIVALIAPAAIIFVLCLASTLPFAQSSQPQKSSLRSIAWDIHAGWLGLAVGLVGTLFITSGLKDIVGKPRPDLFSRLL